MYLLYAIGRSLGPVYMWRNPCNMCLYLSSASAIQLAYSTIPRIFIFIFSLFTLPYTLEYVARLAALLRHSFLFNVARVRTFHGSNVTFSIHF